MRHVGKVLAEAGVETAVRQLEQSTRTAAEASAALGCELGAIVNSLVFLSGATGDGRAVPVLVLTSGRHRVDTDRVAAALDLPALVRASPEQARAATGQVIGGVAPVGHPTPLQSVVDSTLREYDPLWAAAGGPHAVFAISFFDLVRITNGSVLEVTTPA